MKSKKALFALAVTVSFGAPGLYFLGRTTAAPAWTPVVARQSQEVYELSGNGKKLVQQSTGVYLRGSDGSVYERRIPIYGLPLAAGDLATLEDAAEGKIYQINYQLHQAVLKRDAIGAEIVPRQPPTPESFHAPFSPDRFLGKKAISGVECEGWFLPGKVPGRGHAEIWVAPSLNFLQVKSNIVYLEKSEFVTVLEDIQVGREPDPKAFQIPQGFTIVH